LSSGDEAGGVSATRTPERPNVLLVLTDQQRGDWGRWAGVPVRTPALDSLARRGVHFTDAVCPSPLCAPSRASLASGRRYGAAGVHWNQDYPPDRPTLYGRLREAGYHTVGVGDIDLHMGSPIWGLDGRFALDAQGFADGCEIPGKRAMLSTYRADLREAEHGPAGGRLPPDVDPGPDEPANAYMASLREAGLLEAYVEDMEERLSGDLANFTTTRPAPLPEEAYVDNWVGRRGLEALRSMPAEPWLLAVNFVGPHEPMDVTERMHGLYRDPPVEFPSPIDGEGDVSHREVRRNYAAIVETIDGWLGRYLDAVAERGEREETLVVFASDHGELLGDHGGWTKHSPRHESVHVPLAVAGPGVEKRGRVDEPASLLDVHATALDVAGVDNAGDGRSLRPYLSGATDDHREVVCSGLDPWRMVYDGRYKLIVGYDRDVDPSMTGVAARRFQREHAADRASARERILDRTEPVLFDRGRDPHETTDVADDAPEVVARLADHLPPAVREAVSL